MKRKIIATLTISAALCSANFCTGFLVVKPHADTKYCGGVSFVTQSETINYATKETTEDYKFKWEIPDYTKQGSSTSCANVAGAIVIGYYDRLYENLIPDYTSYMQLGILIMYKSGGVETQAVMESLYKSMGTDVGGAGTTFEGFQNGMKTYVQGQGYTYQTEDLGSLNFEKYKAAVDSGKPVALFLDNFSLRITGSDEGSSETIKSSFCNTAHVVVAYGYKVETYFNSSHQVIANRTYLYIASGLFPYGKAYLCLDNKSGIDRATAIQIS